MWVWFQRLLYFYSLILLSGRGCIDSQLIKTELTQCLEFVIKVVLKTIAYTVLQLQVFQVGLVVLKCFVLEMLRFEEMPNAPKSWKIDEVGLLFLSFETKNKKQYL